MWRSLFDYQRDSKRYWPFFIFALVAVTPGLCLVAGLAQCLSPAVLGAGLLLLLLAGLGLTMKPTPPPRLGRLPPLQREDLRAARSKLLKYRYKK